MITFKIINPSIEVDTSEMNDIFDVLHKLIELNVSFDEIQSIDSDGNVLESLKPE